MRYFLNFPASTSAKYFRIVEYQIPHPGVEQMLVLVTGLAHLY